MIAQGWPTESEAARPPPEGSHHSRRDSCRSERVRVAFPFAGFCLFTIYNKRRWGRSGALSDLRSVAVKKRDASLIKAIANPGAECSPVQSSLKAAAITAANLKAATPSSRRHNFRDRSDGGGEGRLARSCRKPDKEMVSPSPFPLSLSFYLLMWTFSRRDDDSSRASGKVTTRRRWLITPVIAGYHALCYLPSPRCPPRPFSTSAAEQPTVPASVPSPRRCLSSRPSRRPSSSLGPNNLPSRRRARTHAHTHTHTHTHTPYARARPQRSLLVHREEIHRLRARASRALSGVHTRGRARRHAPAIKPE